MAIFHQIGGISSSSIGNVFKNPLSSLLEGGKGNVLNLKFPEDLGTDASRMHCVQIEIYNIISASAQQKVQAKETNPSTRETLFGKLNKVAESTVESAKNAITSVASDATKAVMGKVGGVVGSFSGYAQKAANVVTSSVTDLISSTGGGAIDVVERLNKISGEKIKEFSDIMKKAMEFPAEIENAVEYFKSQADTNAMQFFAGLLQKSEDYMSGELKQKTIELRKQCENSIALEKAKETGGGTGSGASGRLAEKIPYVKEANDILQNLQTYISPSLTELKGKVSLYMPSTMTVNYGAHWEQYDLANAAVWKFDVGTGQAVMKAIEGGGDAAEKAKKAYDEAREQKLGIKDTVKKVAGAVGHEITSNDDLAETALYLAKKFGNSDLLSAAEQYFGRSINPQTMLGFKTNDFRTFTLDFVMTPRNKAEADAVVGIVNALTYASTMSCQGGSRALKYPSMVQLKFMSPADGVLSDTFAQVAKTITSVTGLPAINGVLGVTSAEENQRIFKFDKMVINSVSVDYSPNGWTAFSDGTPVQTRLAITFTEWALPTRERMEKGIIR